MARRLGPARRREGASLEQENSEPRSPAVAGQEEHAPAPLTPGRQVSPVQLALTSHLYRLRVGQLLRGWGLSAQKPVMWGTLAWGRTANSAPSPAKAAA